MIAVLLALLLTAPAAADLRTPDGRPAQPYTRWTQQARIPTPTRTITVITADCPYYAPGTVGGCALPDTIWLSMDRRRDRFAFFHELGHVFDATVMDNAARDTYREITGATGEWDGVEERFASHYALCALPRDPALLPPRRVCSMIRRQARHSFPGSR